MVTRPVDEKIVVMKLDNSDFQRKAVETTSMFGKLRDALGRIPNVDLKKTTEEIGEISTKTRGMNLDTLSNSVQTVAGKFSTLGIVAITTLQNITNRAVNAGISLGKSLTLDQAISGFREYELKIGSIKTILANTEWAGTTLTDVKGALEDLNVYADQTIYNFAQMTQNIGRFTAAGVKIDDATIAIKGLSNLAAVSGSDVNQLNTAMYQMSQAMAAGKMNLMDWNSLVNAGMGGKKTQDALLSTAKAMGKNVDMSEGFRNSISDGWLTSEIFLETLKKFGADKSMIEAATKVRTFTQLMDTLQESIGSGWAVTFEHIFGDFEEATKLWSGLADSITSWVGKTSDSRNSFLKAIADKDGFSNIFQGISLAVKPLIQIFEALGNGFKRVFPPKSVDQVIKMTQSFRSFAAGLKLNSDETGRLTTIFQGVFSVFNTVFEIVKRLGKAFLNLVPPGIGGNLFDILEKLARMAISFNESVKEGNALTSSIDSLGFVLSLVGESIGVVIDRIGGLGGAITDNLGKAVDWIKSKLEPLGKFLKDTFGGFGGDEIVGTGMLVGILAVVQEIIKFVWNANEIVASVKEVFEGVSDAIKNFAMGIKIANLMLIAVAIAILAASLKSLEGIETADLTRGLSSLAVALGVMIAGMMVMDKFKVTGGMRASITLIALATAVNIMASALKKLVELDSEELTRGIGGLIGITAALAAGMIAISKWGGRIKVGSLQLIALAGAVYILAEAIDVMSSINPGKLFTSIGAMALIFAQLAIFLKIVDRTKFGVGSALGLVAVSGALHIIISAIERFDNIDTNVLVKGLTTIAIILAEIAIFSKIAGGPGIIAAGTGLIIIAGAINALVPPIKSLGGMSLEELAKGLGAMALALAAVTAAGILASGTIGGAVAITLMAAALNLLAVPIKTFASLTWGELLIGLVGLGASLAVVAGVSMLLSPAIPAMLGFGAAIAIMGVAMLAAGAGIALFAAGLGTLVTITAAAIASIIATLAVLIQGLGTLIPAVVNFVVELGMALIGGIGKLIPALVELVASLIVKILTTITKYLPDFIKTGTKLILQLLEGLGKAVPELIDGAIKFIVQLIEGLAKAIKDNGPQLISAVLELLGEIIILVIEAGAQVITALFGWIPGVKDATAKIGDTAEKVIRDTFGAKEAGEDKGKDFANGLDGKKDDAKKAGEKVADSAEKGTSSADIKAVGKAKGMDFATAMDSQKGLVKSSGVSLATAGKQGAGSVNMDSTGKNFGSGFASGISKAYNSVVNAAKNLARAAKRKVEDWLNIQSPSREMMKDGKFFGEGLAVGIANSTKTVEGSARDLATTAQDSLNKFLTGFELPEEDSELHFKAVIDYDSFDTSRFGNVGSVQVRPDTSFTNGLIAATKADLRQNESKTPRNNSVTNNNEQTKSSNSNQPIVIQSVLNGRVIAEETFNDVNRLLASRTGLDYVMGG